MSRREQEFSEETRFFVHYTQNLPTFSVEKTHLPSAQHFAVEADFEHVTKKKRTMTKASARLRGLMVCNVPK